MPSQSYKKITFALLFLFVGIAILLPNINFHPILSQGDHGRDLYAFEQTMNGAKVYRDYWWVYGPLMPYYYAAFYKIFGIGISSVLLGKALLVLLSGLCFYFVLSLFISPALSFAGAFWFIVFNPEFFFTFNHIGGIFFILLMLLMLLRYLKKQNTSDLYFGLLALLLLSLVKINFGIMGILGFALAVFFIDRTNAVTITKNKRLFYVSALVILPIIISCIYSYFVYGLPVHVIRQCFPYLKGDEPYNQAPLLGSLLRNILILFRYISSTATSHLVNILLAIVVFLSAIKITMPFLKKETKTSTESRHILTAVMILAMFYIINLNEFILSGVMYRLFWSSPLGTLLIFVIIGFAASQFTKIIQLLIFSALISLPMIGSLDKMDSLRGIKTPWQFISHPRANVFTGNGYPWINTVVGTTDFLERNLKKDELFFALPYDVIYYFLTGKESPTRQLIFFDHIRIPDEQERSVIKDLENKKVNWIVLSSRYRATNERGLGILGQTYCPLIGRYIEEHFKVVGEFGDWINPPGWAWNHGTRILKRIR